jgi:parallel beta-helix repeat protein
VRNNGWSKKLVMQTDNRAFVSATASIAVVYVDPTAAAGGNGSLAHPYNSWNFGPLQAGTEYLQKAGTTADGTIIVSAVGTAAKPVTIGAYGKGAAPVLDGAVDFTGAAYAAVSGLSITNSAGAAIIVQQGSSHITVAGNTITHSQSGIWINDATGRDVDVVRNTVTDSAGGGILVSGLPSTRHPNVTITRNTVSDSGGDGIQIISNYVTVSDNDVSESGLTEEGASGIQVYASSATAGVGLYNTITGNVLVDNHDAKAQDGNGILLDQWTGYNVVSDNFATRNDGAGIALYDSAHNSITGNILGANAMDSGDTHSIHAEISLNDSIGLTKDNVFSGNTALSFLPGGVAVFVDAEALKAGNAFSGDILENAAGGDVFQAGATLGNSASVWNALMHATDAFSGVDVSAPVTGEALNYRFAAHTLVTLDSHVVHLVGWSATAGLVGT